MGGPHSKVPREEVLAAFQTDEPLKTYSARIGMSPNTLRAIWKEAFGEAAFNERGKRLQAEAAAVTARAIATTRIYKDVRVQCSECRSKVVLSSRRVAQMADTTAFICDDCHGDRACPVCDLRVEGEKGLSGHFRHRREAGDVAHLAYLAGQEEARWTGRQDKVDFVTCLVCGHRSDSLARHLKAAHGITAEGYRAKYPEARVWSAKVSATHQDALREGRKSLAYEGTKFLICPVCAQSWDAPKFAGAESLCPACRQSAEDAKWDSLSEPDDFVSCLECSYRAENLTSHIQNAHPGYRDRHPGTLLVALRSAVRDKAALVGLRRSPEFKQHLREVKTLGLTRADFMPFLESDGTVDHRAAMRVLLCSWPTLRGYMGTLGLTATTKYVSERHAARRIVLTPEVLAPFKLGNGKISVALAMSRLGLCNLTIKRECTRHGLVWAHGNVSQRRCLDAVSEALDGRSYQEEWKSWRFINPLTGHRFRFDGHFPDIGLVVEFQGRFHYTFPNAYMIDESYRSEWEKLRERDRIKRELITAAPDLTYFEVLEDEPYTSVEYLRGRLFQLGLVR